MRVGVLMVLFASMCQFAHGQMDSVRIGLNTWVLVDTTRPINYDSLLAIQADFVRDYAYYKRRYKETDLMYKVTDNKGNGFDSLYGTRNMRPILHGVAYRGGSNNYYHKTNKRNNHNPIPLDGMSALCKEGFSNGVYLYRENFEHSPLGDTCDCVDNSYNAFNYHQLDYFDSTHVYEMLKMTHAAATKEEVGPVYLHCWNGWHASGYISAVILRQFCEFSNWDAVNYWDLGTDGANTSPRYQTQRERIKNFTPYPEFNISDSLQNCLCPPMPENIDSTQLHIEIEHLVVVPEAIPINFQIVLYNVKFGAGRTSFGNISGNPDIVNLKKALDMDPNLVIEVGGYTDNSGSYSKNVTISKQRALFVYNHLLESGYAPERLSYKGYGPAKPIYSNRYRSTREGNRRIEIKIINKTVHGGTGLVDESIYNNSNAPDEEKLKKSYLSYFFDNQTENLGSVFIVDSLEFASSSFELPTEGKGILLLDQLAAFVQKKEGMQIRVKGYTDASGIEDNNLALSRNRAKAVYDYLISKGLEPKQVMHLGLGSKNPIAPNRYKWGRDINRRIEIEFVSR